MWKLGILLAIIGAVSLVAAVQANDVPVNYDSDTQTLTITTQHFKVLSHTSSSVTVEYLEGGMYYRPGEPPGPTNPFYPCVTTFRSSGFQWEKDAVELVNR